MKRNKKIIEIYLGLAAAGVVFLAISRILGFACIIRHLTGYSCPGCGMTRAWIFFLSGYVREAFMFHPLFPLGIFLILIPVLEEKLPKRIFNAVYITIALLFLVVYIIRMVSGSPFLTHDYHNGLIWRSLHDGINWIMQQR
ncbi:MAG: DUF2752 domain-containing protein [Lachnospiraceae bacterium]|nr:DUF2752 domain-containing protein [Lachnospiraceae bacterium]